ncbi:MAG: hypothetical protein ACD_46C00140G0003 [uncultured bacterium]|nr:MAG: hypothetical protein ACD_46C00140G0003 [uncultured bacterium]
MFRRFLYHPSSMRFFSQQKNLNFQMMKEQKINRLRNFMYLCLAECQPAKGSEFHQTKREFDLAITSVAAYLPGYLDPVSGYVTVPISEAAQEIYQDIKKHLEIILKNKHQFHMSDEFNLLMQKYGEGRFNAESILNFERSTGEEFDVHANYFSYLHNKANENCEKKMKHISADIRAKTEKVYDELSSRVVVMNNKKQIR